MAELMWKERSALHYAERVEHYGAKVPQNGVSLQEIRDFKLLHLSPRTSSGAGSKSSRKVLGILPPAPQLIATGKGALLLWTGPNQYLVLTVSETGLAALRKLNTMAISDQTDSRVLIKLDGPKARNTLAKMLSIDLHKNEFVPGTAAVTSMAHCNINLWKATGDCFCILIPASFAEFVWHAILDHAAEFGVDMLPPLAASEAGLFADKPKKTRVPK